MRAFTASAAMRGSSITSAPSRSWTLPLSIGIGDGAHAPRYRSSSHLRRGRGRSRSISRRCSARRRRRESSGRCRSARPCRSPPTCRRIRRGRSVATVATPLLTTTVDGEFCSSVRPLNPSCRSRNAIVPSASRMSGRRDGDVGIERNATAETRGRSWNRARVETVKAAPSRSPDRRGAGSRPAVRGTDRAALAPTDDQPRRAPVGGQLIDGRFAVGDRRRRGQVADARLDPR